MTRDEFERDFYSRTLAYLPGFEADPRPVVVTIGGGAHSAPGHALAASLVNQLARAHRWLLICGDLDQRLQFRDPFGAQTLRQATVGLALAINPFIEVEEARELDGREPLLTIGIGAPAELQVGCNGWCALFGEGVEVEMGSNSLLGAALASSMAAAVAFHRQRGIGGVPAGSYSLWDFGRQSAAQGPPFAGPIDVGSVLQVGAGAVACALDYWLHVLGLESPVTVVDGDDVDVSNLNRQLLFVAKDAGYPDGVARNKADVIEERVANIEAVPKWLDEADLLGRSFDVVLPLANERGARPLLQSGAQTVLLHATTTPNWTAVAHRHVAGHDDCIVCRIPADHDPRFECSTGEVAPATEERDAMDASLPFLSGAAGVLLLAETIRMQSEQLLERRENFGALDLSAPQPVVSAYRWRCADGCRVRMPDTPRLARTENSRWTHLDGAR